MSCISPATKRPSRLVRVLVRTFRTGTPAIVAVGTVVGGTLALVAGPAAAAPTLNVSAQIVHYWPGGPSDFSYTANGFPMGRNIDASASWLAENTYASFSWSAESSGGIWSNWTVEPPVQVTPSDCDEYGCGAYDVLTDIPATACGEPVMVQVLGQSTAGGPTISGSTTLDEYCGPQVWQTSNDSFAGDGFTPGGSVLVTTYDQNDNLQMTQTVTAAPRAVYLRCFKVNILQTTCLTYMASAGGTISITTPLNCGWSYEGYDKTTYTADRENVVCME